jgi:hypothetical protein
MATFSKCITTTELFEPRDVAELEREIKRIGGSGNQAAIAAATAILERAQEMRTLIMEAASMAESESMDRAGQTNSPDGQPAAVDAGEVAALFRELQDARGLARVRVLERVDTHPMAETIRRIDQEFMDILERLDDAGLVKINCE